MADLKCQKCGVEKGYADANIADSLRTCGGDRTVRHTAAGPVQNGTEHDWAEL
jgi:hypothetical protein